MTEPGDKQADFDGGEALSPYSKDYWDLVFEQLGRRKLFKLAISILALIYASAIYAPLLGNDRPYVLEAIDYKAYGQAQRTLYPVALSVGRLVRQGPEGYEADKSEGAEQDWEGALQAEVDAAENRIETLRSYLGPADTELLDSFQEKLEASVAAAGAGKSDEATALSKEAKEIAKEIRTELAAVDPENPEAGGHELVPQKSYPLFETITSSEVFFMVLWAFVLLWPLWNGFWNRALLRGDRDRIRKARRPKLVLVVGTSLAASLLWGQLVGGEMVFEVSPLKRGLTTNEVVATRAVFPPFSYGFAETSSGETFRAPTWTAESEIDEEGYYVRGARVPEPDPITGYKPPGAPVEVRYSEPPRNSPWRHPMGTDSVGRDLLVRMLWGGRVSLSVGLVSAVLLVFIGTVIGALAGYFRGWVDILLSRLIEIVLCFPAFFLILMVVAFIDPNTIPPIIAIVIVIACVRWTGVARLARGEFLRLREQEFTLAARATGVPALRTIFRHVLPNAIGPILVAGAFSVASGILTESALSFLGFGVKHPIPSWGSLVTESRSAEHWWIQFFPGFAIFVTVVCYNLVGDAIRDAVDPKMKVQ
ncbi:MAG TPA: ABC transporter permease subunit [Planctomycetes bacterium]|nr:ABC transporter permease subunit [Planctomycetota bacterium]